MIIREFYKTREDGIRLFRIYSDVGYTIKQEQSNTEYTEAVDVEDAKYTYVETDKMIEIDKDLESRMDDVETLLDTLTGDNKNL